MLISVMMYKLVGFSSGLTFWSTKVVQVAVTYMLRSVNLHVQDGGHALVFTKKINRSTFNNNKYNLIYPA